MQHLEVLESYAHQVSRFLPADQRNEVFHDLLAALVEEVEARAEAAEREPQAADVEVVLQGFGHPLKVAARYQPARYLIGPALYPTFMRTWGQVLLVGFALLVLFGLVGASVQGWVWTLKGVFNAALDIGLWLSFIVFTIFVSLQYADERLDLYGRWRPSLLGRHTLGVVDRTDTITDLVGEGVFLLWWNDVIVLSELFGQRLELVWLAPVWESYSWALNGLFGACFVLHLVVLLQGVWQRRTLLLQVILNSALLALGLVLVLSGPLLLVSDELQARLSDNIQWVLNGTVLVIMAFTAWDIAKAQQLWRGVVPKSAVTAEPRGEAAS